MYIEHQQSTRRFIRNTSFFYIIYYLLTVNKITLYVYATVTHIKNPHAPQQNNNKRGKQYSATKSFLSSEFHHHPQTVFKYVTGDSSCVLQHLYLFFKIYYTLSIPYLRIYIKFIKFKFTLIYKFMYFTQLG